MCGELEIDETGLRKSSMRLKSGEEGILHYRALGLAERGTHHLALWPLEEKVVKLGAPPPPIGKAEFEACRQCIQACPGSGRRTVVHTDSAAVYRSMKLPPGCSKNHVRHERQQFTAFSREELPDGGRVRTIAGTQLLDGLWRHVKHGIPHHSHRRAGSDMYTHLMLGARASTWRWQNSGYCPVRAFAGVVRSWLSEGQPESSLAELDV